MEFVKLVNLNTININLECSTKEEFFKTVSDKVFDLGYVTNEYYHKILEREENFPTGINLGDYGVALPHTDAEYTKNEFIAVCTFKDTLTLNSMEDKDEEVPVKLAFVLGLNQPHSQLKALTELMGVFQNPETVAKLVSATKEEEILDILNSL